MGRLKKNTEHRVTIKDVAAMAGVSIGTVDRVLHGRGEVNQETHDRVMSFVRKLRYTPNLLAKSLALKKNFTIAVLIPDAGKDNVYWKKPVEGFMRAAAELKDFSTKIAILHYDIGDEKSFIREFKNVLSLNPDGIILAPNFHDAALNLIPLCRERDIPFMFVDNDLENQSLAFFGQDAVQSGMVAARLMQYGLKENSIVLVLNLARNKAITRHMHSREKGFTGYFEENQGSKIRTVSMSVDLSLKNEPEKTLKSLLDRHHGVTGIFVTNSRVHRVASMLEKAGINDIILAGYDLVDTNLEYLEKGFIDFLICQKPEDQGYKSAMAMFNYLLNGRPAEKINYSPIDIIMKENVNYYRNNN
jgi:LacI family transcriptional regulator